MGGVDIGKVKCSIYEGHVHQVLYRRTKNDKALTHEPLTINNRVTKFLRLFIISGKLQ